MSVPGSDEVDSPPAGEPEVPSSGRRTGLDATTVASRQAEFGRNEIKERGGTSPWIIFAAQFKEVLVLMLVVAAVVALAIGEFGDAIVIFAAVIINGFLGFSQEYRAERAMAALKRLVQPNARVIRAGFHREVAAWELVPGDLLVLGRGDRVTADARILESFDLTTDQSMLTGESAAVAHSQDEGSDRVYMGTTVLTGRSVAEVTAIGARTQLGRISAAVEEAEPPDTPLQQKLDQVGRWIGVAAISLCILIAGGEFTRIWIQTGTPDFFGPLLLGIALAVAVIPEGLPIVVTITLAVSMHQMAKRKAIVRSLLAAETLGSASVICADKTGTLTLNRMTVRSLTTATKENEWDQEEGRFNQSGPAFDPVTNPDIAEVLRAGTLCSDASIDPDGRVLGPPIETALLRMAWKAGLEIAVLQEKAPRTNEVPFDSQHKWMATEHDFEGGSLVYIKGAPEVIIPACSRVQVDGTEHAWTTELQEAVQGRNRSLRRRTYRVIALARANGPLGKDLPAEMTFLGVVGMHDPPRAESANAIALARAAGVRTIMITGDHRETAAAVAREIGILGPNDRLVDHADISAMDDAELAKHLPSITSIARVTPQDKMRIVKHLQQQGEVVAMTGDGVNDAPALRQADIGIAMGSGSSVAQEAAGMVLMDDNYASIVHAIEEGRRILDNIRRFLLYQLSTNVGAVVLIILAIIVAVQREPALLPTQLLWINILMDGPPALALGLEPPEPGAMERKPQSRDEPIFTKPLVERIIWLGLIMGLASFGLFWYLNTIGGSPKETSTIVFTTFVLFQLFNAFNSRSNDRSILRIGIFSNYWLIGAVVASLTLQILIIYLPFMQFLFGTVALGWGDWAIAIAVSSSVLILEEIRKLFINAITKKG